MSNYSSSTISSNCNCCRSYTSYNKTIGTNPCTIGSFYVRGGCRESCDVDCISIDPINRFIINKCVFTFLWTRINLYSSYSTSSNTYTSNIFTYEFWNLSSCFTTTSSLFIKYYSITNLIILSTRCNSNTLNNPWSNSFKINWLL